MPLTTNNAHFTFSTILKFILKENIFNYMLVYNNHIINNIIVLQTFKIKV